MRIRRPLAGLALAAALVPFVSAAASASVADPKKISWGPHFAPGDRARVSGLLKIAGEDHAAVPTADVVEFSGRLDDLTRSPACGWAVFRITRKGPGGNLVSRLRGVRDCTHAASTYFTFRHQDVHKVQLKVCSEPRRPGGPSARCVNTGTWQTLYVSA